MYRLGLALVLVLGLAPAQAQSPIVPSTTNQITLAGTVAASTRIITGASGQRIYVTALLLVPVATSVVTFTSGTGTNCGTGTANVTGAMTFAAGQMVSLGDGSGAVFALPPGADLCVTIATAAAPGALAYTLF